MFTLRARAMGYEVVVLEPDPLSPAGGVATRHIRAPYDDVAALTELAGSVAAVTTEFENVPATTLDWLAAHILCRPASGAVAVCQDRIREKGFLRLHRLATADFEAVTSVEEVDRAWERIGPPALLKTSRLGYDGKGQAVVARVDEARAAFDRFGRVPCVLERRLHLEREVSVVLARSHDGTVVPFPVGENVHRNGILHTTVVPARVSPEIAATAVATAIQVARSLDYVGVLAVEMFVADGGKIFVNELAPRPHNSGHYTMDACRTCQFEQQVRSLAALPLGDVTLTSPVAMINLLGEVWQPGPPRWDQALALPGVRLHLYGKKEVRPGRKMGHLNCLASSPEEALDLAERAYLALRA
jgi:5-(carboxyamino)imidazole ribonucleotide synthase